MNALEEECLCLCDILINVNKLLAVLLLSVYLFIYFFYAALCCCLFTSSFPFFILMLLLYFCLFIDHVNKQIIFVFGAFVYQLNNTISIMVTIWISTNLLHYSVLFALGELYSLSMTLLIRLNRPIIFGLCVILLNGKVAKEIL